MIERETPYYYIRGTCGGRDSQKGCLTADPYQWTVKHKKTADTEEAQQKMEERCEGQSG